MRLNKEAQDALRKTVHKALSGQCVVRLPARDRRVARRIFFGVSPHFEEYGAVAQPSMLSWQLPNGSRIEIAVHGQDTTVRNAV